MPAVKAPGVVYRPIGPCAVELPGQPRIKRIKAYATDIGLLVYFTRPADELMPDWYSPVDYPASMLPQNTLRHGLNLETEAGTVKFMDDGCGTCGNPLTNWTPSFARRVAPWPRPQ